MLISSKSARQDIFSSYRVKRCVAVLLLAAAGCGRPNSVSVPRLNPVMGEVHFADKNVNLQSADGAIVELHPTDGETAGQKIAGTLSEGSFSIFTDDDGQKILGAPEGSYKVTITAPKNARVQSIPEKYSDLKTTPLTLDVEKGNNRLEPFDLTP